MALSKLHRNGIMTGHVNHFCFACERHFKCEEDAHSHMAKGVHLKNMANIAYFDKFTGENIRKVKCGYFCEFCNIFLKTSTKVAIHVKEPDHINNKGCCHIKREDNGILVDDKIMIGEKAWHSMTDDACALCNTDFDDEEIHKNLSLHIVNLVGSKLQFGPNNIIYRLIDSTSFQCLTCNLVCALNSLDQHSDSDGHKENLKKCTIARKIPNQASYEQGEDLSQSTNGSSTTVLDQVLPTGSKSEILESVPRFQKNDVNIDFLKETAFCKRCNETMKLDMNHINEHILQHDDDEKTKTPYPTDFDGKSHGLHLETDHHVVDEKMDVVKDLDKNDATPSAAETSGDSVKANEANASETINLKDYSKTNHLTFNLGECNAYCRVCMVKIPSAMKSLNEHVNGRIHQKNTAYMTKSLEVVPKTPMETFVKTDIAFRGIFHDDIVVNYKYCLSFISYHGITVIDEEMFGLRCNLCNIVFHFDILKDHIETESHKNALGRTSVVTSLPDEFVREIRPGMYHCGYCNLLFQNWEQVRSHTDGSDHTGNKSQARARIRSHMRDLAQYRSQRQAELLFMLLHNKHLR